MPHPRIEDYALIGDTNTAALVSKSGSIDWLCLPRFDAAACFAALVGNPANGHWRISPESEVRRVRRRYRDDTMILETEFETAEGCVSVIDFMPYTYDDERIDVARLVQGKRGAVPMSMELQLRFDYGRIVPWIRRHEHGLRAIAGPDAVEMHTPASLEGDNFGTQARFTVQQGQCMPFLMTWYASHLPPPAPANPMRLLHDTENWWRAWARRCRYRGRWRDMVMRSLLTLKALTYSPTGGIVAAPTTSLPEQLGGIRNWDYRFCWLRDATFTLYALMSAGYRKEAHAWREWLLRAVAGQPEQLQVLYGLAGERHLDEQEICWLEGYCGSRPVRIGNQARTQIQLDVYGEVMDSLFVAEDMRLGEDQDSWRLRKVILDFLETGWASPDRGLWEVRGDPRHFTHSKVMAWVALDRAIKTAERFGRDGPVERWRALRDIIHRDVCDKGFDRRRGCFVQYYGARRVDAALLMIPLVAFLPIGDPRVQGTLHAIEQDLLVDGLVRRYQADPKVDGLPDGEGAFLACSFWYVDNLTMCGRHQEACEHFDRLLSLCNDVGLLAEEYDPGAKRMLGNFPQAFSHVGLVNSAINLTAAFGPARHRAHEQAAE